jgi:hypothetical protein
MFSFKLVYFSLTSGLFLGLSIALLILSHRYGNYTDGQEGTCIINDYHVQHKLVQAQSEFDFDRNVSRILYCVTYNLNETFGAIDELYGEWSMSNDPTIRYNIGDFTDCLKRKGTLECETENTSDNFIILNGSLDSIREDYVITLSCGIISLALCIIFLICFCLAMLYRSTPI